MHRLRALLIDDSSDDRLLIRDILAREFDVSHVVEAEDAASLDEAMQAKPFDLVITDYNLGFTDGVSLFHRLKDRWPDCSVILCTGTLTEEIAVDALRLGITDYVLKEPQRLMRLPAAVRSALEHARERAATRAAELRYQALFDGAPVGLVRSRREGTILAANPAAVRLAGYPDRESFIGRNLSELFADPDDWDGEIAVLEGGGVVNAVEVRGRRQDGSAMWVSVSSQAVRNEEGHVVHHEWSLTDVTEQRLLVAQLHQAQKMEAVGRVAGGIAHDFNNVLTVVAGCCFLMKKNMLPGDHLDREVELIQGAVERGGRLTHQLLAFSKKQVMEPKILDLNATVTGIEPLLRRLIAEDVDIVVNVDPHLGRVKADPGQMEQVILNLAVNARDAMPNGGVLVIKTSNVLDDDAGAPSEPGVAPREHVVLSVTDTGHGMDPETKGQIFQPFFTTKEPGKGTGLGLSTVYGIVRQTGGHLVVDSEIDKGTTFRVFLPLVREAVVAGPGAGVTGTAPTGTETVLLVEDDEVVRLLAREILTLLGYNVLEAVDTMDALHICESHPGPIELLLTDVIMPTMNGQRLAEEVRRRRPDTRVLFMSGYPGVVPRILESGAPFLQKPFTQDGLSRRLRDVLDAPPPREAKAAPA